MVPLIFAFFIFILWFATTVVRNFFHRPHTSSTWSTSSCIVLWVRHVFKFRNFNAVRLYKWQTTMHFYFFFIRLKTNLPAPKCGHKISIIAIWLMEHRNFLFLNENLGSHPKRTLYIHLTPRHVIAHKQPIIELHKYYSPFSQMSLEEALEPCAHFYHAPLKQCWKVQQHHMPWVRHWCSGF